MGGLFVPDHYVVMAPSPIEMNIASLVWGLTLGFALFCFSNGVRQSWGIWKRTKTINSYVILVWTEWLVSFILSPILWLFLWGSIQPSFWLFFFVLFLWTFQIQCIMQIMINRIALLVRNRTRIRQLQWGAGLIIGVINISVFCIWIPTQLQISPTIATVNFYWDRVEKAIFAVLDVSLNVYFVRLVRSKLISNGLDKYKPLFYYNCMMILVSVSLDIILIGMMSVGDGFIYTQFHPLVYFIKLHIEMSLTDLITKSVQADQPSGNHNSGSGANVYQHNGSGNGAQKNRSGNGRSFWGDGSNRSGSASAAIRMRTLVTASPAGPDGESYDGPQEGIQRKVETQQVVHDLKEEDARSRTSSTEQLQKKYGIV
ncbi:hypothetical protein MN608_09395 [Microdochium nivale]|nr:hypothetical protein MN608_09395 [Microdochium nivale]